MGGNTKTTGHHLVDSGLVGLDHPKQQGLKTLYIANVGNLYVHVCSDLVHARSMTSLPGKILAYISLYRYSDISCEMRL